MENKITFQKGLFIAGIPLLLIASLVFLAQTSAFTNNSTVLSLAISLDFIFFIPLVYFLLIRKTRIPKTTVLPLGILGLTIGSILLPQENQQVLDTVKLYVLPFLELFVIVYLIWKVRQAIRYHKTLGHVEQDFYSALKDTCANFLPPKAALILSTEIALFYFSFVTWKKFNLTPNQFTYHKSSPARAVLLAFLLMILVETVALHLLLGQWSKIAAWILTILSIYTALQVLGILKSLSRRPITIEANNLVIRYGILNEVSIPFEQIEAIRPCSGTFEIDKSTKKLSPFGELEGYSILITLKETLTLQGLYGMKRDFKQLAFSLDEPMLFQAQLDQAIAQQTH